MLTPVAKISSVDHVISAYNLESVKKAEPYRYSCHCDICGKNIKRRFVVLAENENGELLLVGGTCLKNANIDQEALVALKDAKTEDELNAEEEERARVRGVGYLPGVNYVHTKEAIEAAVKCIRAFGYKSRSSVQYGEATTAEDILDHFHRPAKELGVDEATPEELEAILKYGEEYSKEDVFRDNFHAFVKSEFVDISNLGMLAWMVASYFFMLEREEAKAKREAAFAGVKHEAFGEIGKRVKTVVNCTCINTYPGEDSFGCFTIALLKTEDGHLLSWKRAYNEISRGGSAVSYTGIEEGDKVTFSAFTPSGTFESTKYGYLATKIQRAKLVPQPDPGPKAV